MKYPSLDQNFWELFGILEIGLLCAVITHPFTNPSIYIAVNAVNVLDDILQEFSSGIDVDLMPGENDPANQIMPQQPLHCCLFPSKYIDTLVSVILITLIFLKILPETLVS